MEYENHSKKRTCPVQDILAGAEPKSLMSRKNLILSEMKTNKILAGGIAGGVTLFLLGWLIYGILMMDYATANYNQCMNRPNMQMIWWALILSNLAFGFLLSTLFSWSNITGALAGARAAAIIGLLLGISLDLGYYSMTLMYPNLTVVLVDIITYIVYMAIAGAVTGWVMGLVKK